MPNADQDWETVSKHGTKTHVKSVNKAVDAIAVGGVNLPRWLVQGKRITCWDVWAAAGSSSPGAGHRTFRMPVFSVASYLTTSLWTLE